ncbi:MAG: PQQ-binding-like beta-propeller repeat protein [Deltaproteobacteria bacterium]
MTLAPRAVPCAVALLLGLAGGCARRPPAGAGEPERPTPGTRRFVVLPSGERVDERTLAARARRARRVNGVRDVATSSADRTLIADLSTCTVTVYVSGRPAWRRAVPECAEFLEGAIAPDSAAFVRTRGLVVAFEPDGRERWRVGVDDADVTAETARPAALPDSRVALATDRHTVLVLDRDGSNALRVTFPTRERLLESPRGSATDGFVAMTDRGLYFVGSALDVRRHTFAEAP